MFKRVAVIGSMMVVAASFSSSDVSAQYFPGTSSGLTGSNIQSLMGYLGYAPTDYCGFYYFVVTGTKGQFSPTLTQALLPMCSHLPLPPGANNQGNNNGGQGTDPTGGTGVLPGGGSSSGGSSSGGSSSGGSSSGGSSGGSSSGGSSSGGLPAAGGSSSGGSSSGGSSGGETVNGGSSSGGTTSGGPGGNPFGGGGNMVTPEPISLILLGTGLVGIGGVRASRRRRRSDSED